MSPRNAPPGYGCSVPSPSGPPGASTPHVRRVLFRACLAAVVLRLPTFLYPLVSDDEAIYSAMAQVVSHGGTMYRDTVDHKPPGLVYSYSAVASLVEHLGGSFAAVMAGVHVLGILVVALTCLALHAVAREVLEPRLAPVPPVLYALVSAASIPPDALAVNGELMMNLPTALAVACALVASRSNGPKRLGLDVAAGALCGIAGLYKYQAVLVGLSFLFLLPDRRREVGKALRTWLARGAALGAGLVIPFALVGAYMKSRGALGDALQWGLLFNLHYLAEGPDFATAAHRFFMQIIGTVLPNGLIYGGGLLSVVLLVRRVAPKGASLHGIVRGRGMLVVWAAESLFCVTLGRRYFGHYFLQPELPLAVLAAGPVMHLWERRPRLAALGLALPSLAFFGIAALPGTFAHLIYAGDPDYWALGRAVKSLTVPTDSIWVWGNVPQVYFTAERRPGVRFTFCNYLTGLSPGAPSELDPTVDSRNNAVPGAWDMVVADLEKNRPAIIVDTAAGQMKSYGKFPIDSFPVLSAYLKVHYQPEGVVLGAVLLRRTDGARGT